MWRMNSRNNVRPVLSSFNHKSSVLCPESRHITSQYLALEQLEAHYKMVSHAKGSVDTSAPKSLQSYISTLDRKRKQYWGHRSSSFPSDDDIRENTSQSGILQRNVDWDNNYMDGDADNGSMSLNKSIQTGIPFPSFNSKVADKISWYLEAVSQGEFHPAASSNHALSADGNKISGSQLSLSSSLRSTKVIKGDLLDWHKDCFTSESKPFSPRLLSNNGAKSKVLGMRCYNPPRKRQENDSVNSSDAFESYDEDEVSTDVEPEAENENEDDESVSDVQEQQVLHVDTSSHQNWLEDQSLRTHIRRRFRTKVNVERRTSPSHSSNRLQERRSQNVSSIPLTVLSRCEEAKYLKFLSDVTEDILRSGIYTDRAIQRSFEFHLQFYPKDTDKDKLRQLLDQVLEGLQVGTEESDDPFRRRTYGLAMRDSNSYSSTPPEKENLDHISGGMDRLKIPDLEAQEPETDNQNVSTDSVHLPETVTVGLENYVNSGLITHNQSGVFVAQSSGDS